MEAHAGMDPMHPCHVGADGFQCRQADDHAFSRIDRFDQLNPAAFRREIERGELKAQAARFPDRDLAGDRHSAAAAAGVGLTYTVLTGFINRTRVEVNRALLTIRHGPLPWVGNRVLPGRSLAQLYGEEVISKSRNGTSVSYSLFAVDREGR